MLPGAFCDGETSQSLPLWRPTTSLVSLCKPDNKHGSEEEGRENLFKPREEHILKEIERKKTIQIYT